MNFSLNNNGERFSTIILNEKKVLINNNEKNISEDQINISTKKLINYLSLRYMFIIIKTNNNGLTIEEQIYPNELKYIDDKIYYQNNIVKELFL